MLILPNIWYWYNKTSWNDKTDCMIQYVKNYYPNWCMYEVLWSSHIDECWIGNKYMIETKKINGCMINDWVLSFIYNTPYCYITLFYEKTWKIIEKW